MVKRSVLCWVGDMESMLLKGPYISDVEGRRGHHNPREGDRGIWWEYVCEGSRYFMGGGSGVAKGERAPCHCHSG